MATIKITQLPPIGSNLAANTVLPVVNVAGTAATDKTTVGAVGNLILTNAGGANFAPAALANLAYSVVNAAQPNITSVGTLPINTLHIGGGTNGQYLQTDGTGNLAWVSGGGTGNGEVGGANTQIQFNDAGNFGGNVGFTFNKTTGVLAAPFADVSGVANTVGGGATVATKSVLNVASTFGSNSSADPASAQAIRGRVTGSNLSKTRNYVAGVTGQYLVTGTNASEFINTGLLGVVGDQTTTANAAVVAYLDGDGGLTTAGSAYGVSMKNSTPGSGFDYGLDLQFINLNVAGTTTPFKQADIRFNNGVELVANTANNISINANVTAGNVLTSANVIANGAIESGTGFTTGGYLSVDGNTDLHDTSVTGNLSATGNITANNIGNIATINLTGSNANVLYGNGVFAPASGGNSTYGNSNVVTLLSAFGSNTITTTGNVTVGNIIGNGQALTNIAGANVSGFVPNANVANTAFAVAAANVTGLGNIATINLTGSNSNVLYGNGVFAAVAGGNANTGNVTFNDINIIGTGNLKLQPDSANASAYLDIFLTAGPDIHIAGNGETVILGTDDFANVTINIDGNVSIQANAGTPHTWTFGTDGTTTFPTANIDLHNGGVQSGEVLQFGNPNLQAIITGPTPSANNAAERLIIQGQRGNGTGEGGDVYVWGGDADTNGGDIKIYAGDADNVSTGSGGYVNLAGGDGFDNGGDIDITGGSSANGPGGTVYIDGGSGELDGGTVSIQGGYGATGQGGPVEITGGVSGNGQASYGNVVLGSGSVQWIFDNSGNLTLPANTFAVNYANGTQVSIGGGNANTGNVTFVDQVVIGTGDGTTGSGGLYLAPGTDSTANLQFLRVRGGDVASHIHLDTGNSAYFDLYIGDDSRSVKIANTGNIDINTNDGSGNSASWTFGADGTLTLPGDLVIAGDLEIAGNTNVFGTDVALLRSNTDLPLLSLSTGSNGGVATVWVEDTGNIGTSNIAAVYANPTVGSGIVRIAVGQNGGGGPNLWDFDTTGNLSLPEGGSIYSEGFTPSGNPGNTIILQPAGSGVTTDQRLLIYPTAGDGDHIHLTSGNLYQTELFLGSDNLFVKLANTGNIVINSDDNAGNTAQWKFGIDGNLTLPDTTSVIANVSITLEANDTGNITGLNLIGDSNANLYAHGNVTIVSDSSNTTATWNFGVDGNLTVPGSLINDTSIVLSAPAVFNICTIATAGSGYNTGSSLKATTGGSGTGMTVGIGYGLSNQLTNVNVVNPGTGYVNGDVITVSEGTGGTFVITKYNVLANQTNNNTVQTDLIFANNTLTIPVDGNLVGNLIVPGSIVGSGASPAPYISGFSSANFAGNVTANYFLGNGSQLTSLPAPTVSQDITSNGAMSIMLYDGNIKYNNYATVEPSTGNIAGNNITATGNISANNFTGNGGTLSNVATKVEGSWTLAAGVNTVNLSVPINGTYSIWVRGNIPNGIVTYTATVVVTNTNVPVLGSSYGWYYAAGNALVLTAIPTQIVGTVNNISNAVVSTSTANVFTFGITNNSGNTAVVDWGYTKL